METPSSRPSALSEGLSQGESDPISHVSWTEERGSQMGVPFFYTPGMIRTNRGWPWILGFLAVGCASAPGGAVHWPYPSVNSVTWPLELQGQPQFLGRWIESDPPGDLVITETSVSRYIALFPFENSSRRTFLDFGMGTEVETLAFLSRNDYVLFVGAVTSPHTRGNAVYARSLLLFDLVQGLLIDTFPLPPNAAARGFAVDHGERRAYLLHDNGVGKGTVDVVDLYGGGIVVQRKIGDIPRMIDRKGLALSRDARHVFCLAGGESARSDFAPVDSEESGHPELVVLDGDSLSILAHVTLSDKFEPQAVAYDESTDRVYVLETNQKRSALVIIDGTFFDVRDRVLIPERTTDLVLRGGFAFCPAGTGIYVVDLRLGSLAGRSSVAFEFSGEIAVSADLATAFVLFRSGSGGEAPGIAHVALQTGEVMRVLH